MTTTDNRCMAAFICLTLCSYKLGVAALHVDPAGEMVICAAPGGQSSPDIYGDIVVWVDARSDFTGDIYGKDLSTGLEFAVCTNPEAQRQVAIHGDIVVWVDYRNGPYPDNADIYGKNISTGQEFPVCTDIGSQLYPAVYGNIVVWHVRGSGILGKDLSNGQKFNVFSSSLDTYDVDIDGQTIVWHSGSDIFGADISDVMNPIVFQINTPWSAHYPVIHKNKVVWVDYRTWWVNSAIYGKDLSTGQEFPVCLNEGASYPDIYGNIVVWQDNMSAGHEIHGADISDPCNPKEFPICTDATLYRYYPAIHGDVVVWQDNRNGGYDIYGNRILGTPSTVTIRGTVYDAVSPPHSPQPLAGVEVRVNGEPTLTDTTDAEGKYDIGGVPAERISVTASKTGYRSESQFLPYPPAAQCPYKNLCDGPDSLHNVNLHLVPIDAIDCNTSFRPIKNGFHYKNIGWPSAPGGGLCLGMAFAAYNLWTDDTIPSPRSGETDIDWLQESDDAQAKMIRDLQFKYGGDLYYGQWPFKTSSLDKLCTDLDLGKPRVLNLGNLVLGMLECKHTVLAYHAVKKTPNRCLVWVYDPDYPETENVITFTKIFINKWNMDTYRNTGWNGFNVVPDSGYFRPDSPYKFKIVAHSPVSLKVIDPDGSILSQNLNEIDWGRYQRLDYNGDGNDDEVVTILWPKDGLYSVQVIPKPDALPTDTYSLEVTFDDETVVLAEDITISDIPDEPYVIQCTPTGINVAPIANAGEDQTVFATVAGIAQVALDGSGSSDPDGDDLTYSWYLDGQKIATGVSPTIQLPAGVYVIDLVVSDGTADSQPDQVRVIVIQTVGVDIKPGSWPNTINLGSNGVIPVAILTTESFDATSVDPSTVQLEGLGVAVRGKSEKLLANDEDVDEDGDIDLVVKIETENLEPGAWQSGLVVLTGETYDGLVIEGCDEIIIVPPEK